MPSGSEATLEDSDARLVARVREGDHAAFATLVERYHALVLVAAERITRDRDDAFDIAQDVLLKVHQQIDDLRRPEKLNAWLLAITRNHALGVIRRRCHAPVEHHWGDGTAASGMLYDILPAHGPTPHRQAELRELTTTIREQLDELDAKYAEILRLYYLEGLDLPEIARRTGVQSSTAKWRLWRARQRLRKELMMSELSDEIRAQSTSQPLLKVSAICGSAGPNRELHPWQVAKSLLAQQVLFCVRKEAKAAKEIAREVKADISYVNEHLAKLTEADLLEETDGAYRANFILLDESDIAHVRKELAGKGAQTAEVIRRHSKELSGAIAALSPSARGFDEGYLKWIILPTMVLNFGVRKRLQQTKGLRVNPPARPCGGSWFFLPALTKVGLPSELGCNWSGGTRGHAQYWNSDIAITMTKPSLEEIVILHRLAEDPLSKQSLVDVFSEETLAGMIEHGLARVEGDGIAVNVPVFTPADGDMLDPILASITDDILEEVYAEFPDSIYAMMDSLGFSFIRGDYPAHAMGLAQFGAVRALVDAGILPAPPSKPRQGWGFCAWSGTFAPMQFR